MQGGYRFFIGVKNQWKDYHVHGTCMDDDIIRLDSKVNVKKQSYSIVVVSGYPTEVCIILFLELSYFFVGYEITA